jgi:DNA-binding response OmpR family regulator
MGAHGTKTRELVPASWGGVEVSALAIALWEGGHARLTPGEAILLATILRGAGKPLHPARLVAALYSGDPDGGPLTALDGVRVLVSRLRTKLRGAPIHLATRSTLGYFVHPAGQPSGGDYGARFRPGMFS